MLIDCIADEVEVSCGRRCKNWGLSVFLLVALCSPTLRAQDGFAFSKARHFLDAYSQGCHTGKAAQGVFRADELSGEESFRHRPEAWLSIAARVSTNEMPPTGAALPAFDDRLAFVSYLLSAVRLLGTAPHCGCSPVAS